MTTFFDLPYEIRIEIWMSTVEPRMVPVRVKGERRVTDSSEVIILHAVSSAPVPKTLHICQESRSLNVYEKFYISQEIEASYVWVNLQLDIIDIGEQMFELFENCGNRIRRLHFIANNTCETWYRTFSQGLGFFDNLVQCFVLAGDGWESWEEAFYEHYWSCDGDNLYIIDKERGGMMSFYEVERWMEDDNRYEREEEVGVSQEMAVVTLATRKK